MAIQVLLVDDSENVRESFRSLLEQEGYEVVGEAANGKEGVKLAKKFQPDIVLMDIKMPIMNGFEAALQIKKTLPLIKIIALTIYVEKEIITEAAESGFSAFIIKGETIPSILQTLRLVYGGEKSPRTTEKSQEFAQQLELSEKLSELSVLIKAGQQLAGSRSKDEILSTCQRLVPKVAGTAHILIRDNTGTVYWLSSLFQKDRARELFANLPRAMVKDLKKDSWLQYPELAKTLDVNPKKLDGFKSLIVCPLKTESGDMGTLECYYKSHSSLSQYELEGLYTLSAQIALTLEGERLKEDLKELFFNTVKALSAAIEAKEPYLKGHSENVALYAVELGEKLSLTSTELDSLRLAGLLHDIGKIGVDDRVLKKRTPLTKEDKRQIQAHPEIGAKIIESIRELGQPAVAATLYHHERWDGEGYPTGLKGEKIPFFSRILGVADAFDAMTTKRVYRPALSVKVAREELKRGAGKQFDPEQTEVFLEMIKNKEVSLVSRFPLAS